MTLKRPRKRTLFELHRLEASQTTRSSPPKENVRKRRKHEQIPEQSVSEDVDHVGEDLGDDRLDKKLETSCKLFSLGLAGCDALD